MGGCCEKPRNAQVCFVSGGVNHFDLNSLLSLMDVRILSICCMICYIGSAVLCVFVLDSLYFQSILLDLG